MGIAIVTDSTSDIEPARAAHLGVTVVPLFVVFGERSYRDYLDLSREEFYQKLAREKTLPITSQPTSAMFEEAFAAAAAAGDDILCIVISQALSGTINAARAAAERFPQVRIALVDSESVAGGLGMQVTKAVKLRAEGAGLDDIVASLAQDRKTQRLYAALPDLSHVVRTGRIGKAKAALGTLMKIVPVIALLDGHVDAAAQVRTFARAQETMIDMIAANLPDPSEARITVVHTQAPELAARVAQKLLEKLGRQPQSLDICEAGPVIATHAGAGAVGIFSVT